MFLSKSLPNVSNASTFFLVTVRFFSYSIMMNFAPSAKLCVWLLRCWHASMVVAFFEIFAMIVDAYVKLSF